MKCSWWHELILVGECPILLNISGEIDWGRKSICELICIPLQKDSNCVPSGKELRQGGAPGRKVSGHDVGPGELETLF